MKRVKSKLSIAVIAVAAIVLLTGLGAYAYWSVSQQLAGNQLSSGHMSISVLDYQGTALTALQVPNMMPGTGVSTPLKKTYEITSATGNPDVDLAFSVPTVTGNGTLKDNVKIAFALMTGGFNYWLEPSGAVAFTGDTDQLYSAHGYNMSAYAGKSWGDLAGYKNIPDGDTKHIMVYYYLPLDCANDCHDSDATFDMSFELLQSH